MWAGDLFSTGGILVTPGVIMGISMLRSLSIVSDGILIPTLIELLIRKQSESLHSLGLVW